MSPIDDELRAALHGRAQVLTPAPDPLAGIERRARRIRRNRVAASVAGSALAVAAIAAVVPALQSATSSAPREAQFATTAPTPAVVSAYALDPIQPWGFRGMPVDEGSRATIEREYAARYPGAEVAVTPLFAQVYQPSQLLEVVFLAQVDGDYRWGVAQATEGGPELGWDEPLPEPAYALAAALPGDEAPRLLVVASPEAEAGSIRYSPDGGDGWQTLDQIAPGVATVSLEGDTGAARYQVLEAAGGEVVQKQVPGPTSSDGPTAPSPGPADEGEAPVIPQGYGWDPFEPWAFRGKAELTAAPNLAVEDERLFTERHGEGWSTRPLYAAESDAGVSLLFVLHTKEGEADLVSTTWQVGNGPAEYADQVVDAGQALIQKSFPTTLDDGERLLVALASPKAGGIVLTGPGGNRPDGVGDKGVGLWAVNAGEDALVRLYTEGDGVEYLVEPAATR